MRNIGIGLGLQLFVAIATAAEYPYHPTGILHLGATFDPKNMTEVHVPCLVFDAEVPLDGLGSGTTQFSAELVRTRQQFYRYLNVSATLSAHYTFYSGGGAFSWEAENSFDSDSMSWIIRGTTTYGRFGMSDAKLHPRAQMLLKNKAAFAERCGTEYVGEQTKGVLVAAIFTIRNLSQSDRTKLEASFSGGVSTGLFSAELATKFQQFYQAAAQNGTISTNVYAIGGAGITKLEGLVTKGNDINEVQKAVAGYLATLTVDKSIAFSYTTGSLRQFGWDGADPNLSPYSQTLNELFYWYRDYQAYLDRLRELLRNPNVNDIDETDLKRFEGLYYQSHDRITEIAKAAQKCLKTPPGCVLPRNLVPPIISWPEPRPTITTSIEPTLTFPPVFTVRIRARGRNITEGKVVDNAGRTILPLSLRPGENGVTIAEAEACLIFCNGLFDNQYTPIAKGIIQIKEKTRETSRPVFSGQEFSVKQVKDGKTVRIPLKDMTNNNPSVR